MQKNRISILVICFIGLVFLSIFIYQSLGNSTQKKLTPMSSSSTHLAEINPNSCELNKYPSLLGNSYDVLKKSMGGNDLCDSGELAYRFKPSFTGQSYQQNQLVDLNTIEVINPADNKKVKFSELYTLYLEKTLVDKRIVNNLLTLLYRYGNVVEQIKNDGASLICEYPVVVDGFRDQKLQEELYVASECTGYPYDSACVTAAGGWSHHQAGVAIDIECMYNETSTNDVIAQNPLLQDFIKQIEKEKIALHPFEWDGPHFIIIPED